MKSMITRHLFHVFVVFVLLGSSAFAQDTSFRRVQLSYGISLEIPSHWTVLSQDTRRSLGAAGSAMMDNAGIEGSITLFDPKSMHCCLPSDLMQLLRIRGT